MPPLAMIEHLVGMQAQVPQQPYVGLWSRLAEFVPLDLERLVLERAVVRTPVMRTTIHLVSADDARTLRSMTQPVLERTFRSSTPWHRQLGDVDLPELVAVGRALVEAEPRTAAQLAAALTERWPGRDGLAMAQAVRYLVPMVQVPPRGLWSRSGQPRWTTTETWLGAATAEAEPPLAERRTTVVRRYLAAFGPATVADLQTWCGLAGLRAVVEDLRPSLLTFRDEAGRERFDLPEAPRPDADTPAPPRLLPEYDNVLLSHKDRSHVIPPAVAARLAGYVGTFLIDGRVHGQWRVDVDADGAHLVLDPFLPLAGADETDLVGEAERYLAWHAPHVTVRHVAFGRAR
jgi:hypothetical protein